MEDPILEPVAREMMRTANGDREAEVCAVQVSIAISLKRIADALEPNHVTEGGALNVRDLLSELVEQRRG